jgi:hypothetical protein
MRTRAFPAAAAVALCALAAPASAQIIATSIPKEFTGSGKTAGTDKKWAFHIMATPFAKWKYGEIYAGAIDDSVLISLGNVQATPNSDFLFAGEVAFKAGENWSIGVGGWYNKVGATTYEFSGDNLGRDGLVFGVDADLAGDLNLFEGHLGIFYKDFGIQGGLIKTSGDIGTTATVKTFRFGNQSVDCASTLSPAECTLQVPTSTGDTTDWDLFGVYKHTWGGSYPVGISLGAGVYGKQGEESSPLRSSESQTVFSGFATLNVGIYKGLGIDTSFWYIDKTGEIGAGDQRLGVRGSDNQYRLTIGLGYTFSQ